MPKHELNSQWGVCLAASLPLKIEPEDKADSRLDMSNPEVQRAIAACKKRVLMEGFSINGQCGECVCIKRFNFEPMVR